MRKIIEVKNISKKFNDKLVVSNVNLTINDNDIVGIIGRNGSGKTVLLKIICGLYIPTEGRTYINGDEVTTDKVYESLGVLIDVGFLNNETGHKNLKLLSNLVEQADEGKIFDTLKKVGLDPCDKTKYKNYSTGMKQKLKFAQAILFNPEIIILDEPFNGLDKDTVKLFRNIIKQYKEDGKTILLTSHYQEDIDLLCDKVYEMENGVLKEVISNEEQ